MSDLDSLREATDLIRDRAKAAREHDDERWMVDQSPDAGLILGAYVPEDVAPDGSVSTSCVAYFAYPDDEARRTYSRALAVASHTAGFDPVVADQMADWLNDHWSRALADPDWLRTSGDARRAVEMAKAYLRVGSGA